MIDKNELKQRLPLEVVLAHYGQPLESEDGFLSCPFHHDKTPSFHYNLKEGVFYCHGAGCNAKGDIFNFIQLKEGCGFQDSLRIANKILGQHENGGISLTTKIKKKASERQKKVGLHRIFEKKKNIGDVSPERFQEAMGAILEAFPLPKEIKEKYLIAKTPFVITGSVFDKEEKYAEKKQEEYVPPGFSQETVFKFRIGYCGLKSKDAMKELKEKGFSDGELIATGFFKRNIRDALYVVKHMQGRILYPFIRNGKVVQIAGRKIDGFRTSNKYAKTKHCPGTGQIFNHDILKNASSVLITEGVTDCIKSNEAGISSVSPVGKDVTRITLRELGQKLKGKRVGICFDNDRESKAGQNGAKLTQEKLREHGIESVIITLPRPPEKEKIDVCEFINVHGKEAFLEVLRGQGF
jgi:DNA primase